MFDALGLEIKAVANVDPDALTDEELTSAAVELGRLETMLAAARNRLLGAWDTRGAWRADGAKSAAADLAYRTRAPKVECASRLRLERSLRHLPVVAEAWRAGELSMAHAQLLARARNDRTAELLARDEALLVHRATTMRFAEFQRVVAYWSMHADPDGAGEKGRRDRRRVSFDITLSGMGSGAILLDPVNAETFGNELRGLERRLFEADWAEAKERLGRDPHVGELARTGDQRRADALVEMAERSASLPEGTRPARPLFQVVLGSDSLRHLCELAGSGTVISPAALLPWISDAEIERYLFEPLGQRVISVSYRRTFEGALRDLIKVRDRECFHPTCDEPAARCQVDHIEPHSAGGITAQDNGRLACGVHNRGRHSRRGPP